MGFKMQILCILGHPICHKCPLCSTIRLQHFNGVQCLIEDMECHLSRLVMKGAGCCCCLVRHYYANQSPPLGPPYERVCGATAIGKEMSDYQTAAAERWGAPWFLGEYGIAPSICIGLVWQTPLILP